MDLSSSKPFVRPLISAAVVSIVMTGVLAYMVESRASILRSGTEIRLKTAPVDPHDLLRGDYVTLNYDVSTVPADLLTGQLTEGQRISALFIRLTPGDGGFWQLKQASVSPLPAAEGTVVLKSLPFNSTYTASYPVTNIPFGIERYYVPEGQGKAIETEINSEDLAVVVRVSDTGVPQISRLELKGTPLYNEPLY